MSFTIRIRPVVDLELALAQAARLRGDSAAAFTHLERAHVLGQASTALHVRVHWLMLLWGLRERNVREILGQALRIVGAATKTALGLVPQGNTGGANVSAVERMPIPADLQREIDVARGRA